MAIFTFGISRSVSDYLETQGKNENAINLGATSSPMDRALAEIHESLENEIPFRLHFSFWL